MPGRILNMDTNGANSAKPIVNGKQSPAAAVQPAQSGATESIPGHDKRHSSTALTNGENGIPGLGAYPTPNGVSPSSPSQIMIPASMSELPEELQHITDNFYSLGTLIDRVTQECFAGLDETIDQLSKIQIDTQPLTNGAGNHLPALSGDVSPENKRKKMLMMEFIENFRPKFIKLLVLSHWSKGDAKAASKLIDINYWLNINMNHALEVEEKLFELWRDIRGFKIGGPDLDTSLAVLSKGDVPWIPHLGFRKRKPLPAVDILKIMHQMNTMINLRLVLHEDLIPQLRDYKVADGRATFSVPSEFELDVYISSDDYTRPWYFSDVRFLFNPAPPVSGEWLQTHMDFRLNQMLALEGLDGACDFIHNFVLTHKIGVLHRQALELSSGLWALSLGVEQPHRTLCVQYWLDSSQPKSWIEIGITSGREKSRRKPVESALSSQIKARWIRNGKEQKDAVVPIDLTNLSIEQILNAHIARHSNYILESVRSKLEAAAEKRSKGEHKGLETQLSTSNSEPQDCVLKTQIGDHPAISLQIDPITGRLYLDPVTPATLRAQNDLQHMKDPANEAHSLLSRCLSFDIFLRIDRLADIAGWDMARNQPIKLDDIKAAIKRDVHRFGFLQPRGFKNSNWYIAFTINLCGESWWAMEINSSPAGKSLGAWRQLPTADDDGQEPPVSLQLFKRVEQLAVRTSSYLLASRDFKQKGVNTSLRYLPVDAGDSKSATELQSQVRHSSAGQTEKSLPSIMVRFSQLLKSKSDRFASDLLQLRYLAFDTNLGQVKLVAKGKMRNPSKVQDILKHTHDSDVGFSLDGSFSILIRAKLGTSCADKVVAHLRTLSTLCNFAKVLNDRNLECKDISFKKVCFKYGTDLEITLVFAGTEKAPRIKLEISPDNPHIRIKPLLEEIVNDHEMGFERFTIALEYFLPVLRAFQTIDSRHVLEFAAAPRILPRAVDFYRLVYPNPNAPLGDTLAAFDLNFKRNKDHLEWRVSDATVPPLKEEREKLFPGFNAAVLDFMKQVGTGWTGMNTLVVADQKGIEAAVLKLDEVVSVALKNAAVSSATGPPAVNGLADNQQANAGPEVITID